MIGFCFVWESGCGNSTRERERSSVLEREGEGLNGSDRILGAALFLRMFFFFPFWGLLASISQRITFFVLLERKMNDCASSNDVVSLFLVLYFVSSKAMISIFTKVH